MVVNRKQLTKWYPFPVLAILLATILTVAGCTGATGLTGPTGPAGQNGINTGTFSGKVSNGLTNQALSGVTVTVTADASITPVTLTSANDGTFTTNLPIGSYTVAFKKTNYTATTQTVNIVAGQTSSRDVALQPTAAVLVSAGSAQEADPASSVNLKAAVTILDNSTITSYQWTQVSGVEAQIDNASLETAAVTLAPALDYKTALLDNLKQLDRWVVQAINPDSLILAEDAVFKLTVTTSSGKYTANVTVSAKMPYSVSTGLKTVPIGVPVLLHGKSQWPYNWKVAGPAGTKAVIDVKNDQNPSFTPDLVGKYTVTETVSGTSIDIYGV
ncbi:MAG: carboxypeptidase regulatory-like domain-containing protein, partial [Dehalococcoidales bacterium]|nr:carboxypeptidase regulatory-like domain-containing protein [Dehalococcoidales bacterium]